MIIVTGATGTLNGATVDFLLKRMPAHDIGVSVRDPSRATHLADQGVRVRQGSYDDPSALRHSFAEAEQVLLVSSSDLTADVVAQHHRAIDAAVDVGAQRIVYTSAHGTAFDTPYPPACDPRRHRTASRSVGRRLDRNAQWLLWGPNPAARCVG